MKLLIAIPTGDFMPVESVKSLIGLCQRLDRDGVDYELKIEAGTLVYLARDRLGKYAIEEARGFTHVLWLDSDMVFTDDIVEDLQFSGHDFVSGICHSRRRPYQSCLFSEYWPHPTRYDCTAYPANTFEVAACGFAAVWMTTALLRQVILKFDQAFLPTKNFGEDVAFCDRARQLGYKIYAEPGVHVGHVGHVTIYPEDYAPIEEIIS